MAAQPKHRQLPDKETKLFKELLVSFQILTRDDLALMFRRLSTSSSSTRRVSKLPTLF
jgi:hypothetical protein